MAKKKNNTPAIELSKYLTSQSEELPRSQIRLAEYNPRHISDDNLKTLRKGIRKFGLVGGIVVNRQTGYTLVSGHQRLSVMDDLQHYNPDTHENDYLIRADIIDLDPKAEKELVILLNNPNAQGEWDYDQLRVILPDIDYTLAGLTEADLSLIGIGIEDTVAAIENAFTEQPVPIAAAMTPPDKPVVNQQDADALIDAQETPAPDTDDTRQAAIDHNKEMKQQIAQQSISKAGDALSYLMLSFDNQETLSIFLQLFDLPPQAQIVKGEEILDALLPPENDTENDTGTPQQE